MTLKPRIARMSVETYREALRARRATWCACCDQRIRQLNPHRMDAAKIRVLEDLAKFAAEGAEWVLAQHGYQLIADGRTKKTAYRAHQHVCVLKWFGLVEHRGPRTGQYRITKRGLRFLQGRVAVPEKILVRDGSVVEASDEEVRIRDVRHVKLDRAYWDRYGSIQESPWRERK